MTREEDDLIRGFYFWLLGYTDEGKHLPEDYVPYFLETLRKTQERIARLP